MIRDDLPPMGLGTWPLVGAEATEAVLAWLKDVAAR